MAAAETKPLEKPQKRILLTLNKKIKAIKLLDKGIPAYKVAEQMCVGKTQIQNLRKRKLEVLTDFENNVPGATKRRHHSTGNEDINRLTFEWFKDGMNRGVPMTGPLLQTQALHFATKLEKHDFKASKGWLQSFLKRHDIKLGTRRGDLRQSRLNEWIEKLPSICENYEPEDIFNLDETGLFYGDTSKNTFHSNPDDKDDFDGKQSKDRMTVALCTSMTGEKVKPVVIGKTQAKQCFGKIDTKSLPVHYYHNKKAWMNSSIYEDFFEWFNMEMRTQKRNVLVFVDNAPAHPVLTLSNVKVQFLPCDTTASTQPMDQGIIQAAKLNFRKRQLQHIVREMDHKPTLLGSELLKKITILDAIYWLNHSWQEVDNSTIARGFKKAGFEPLVVSNDISEDGDVKTADKVVHVHIPSTVIKLSHELFGCSFDSLVDIDKGIMTCAIDERDWEKPVQELLAELKSDSAVNNIKTDNAVDDKNPDRNVPTILESCDLINKLKCFATHVGNSKIYEHLAAVDEELSKMKSH